MAESLRSSPLPRFVVAVDQNRSPAFYILKVRVDGSIALRERPLLPERQFRKPFILVLHPDLVFQRDGRIYPKDRRTLESLATDLFPFRDSGVTYAARRGADLKPVFYALKPDRLQEVRQAIQDPGVDFRAILVGTPDAESVKAAIEERLASGPLSDLIDQPYRMRHPAYGRLVLLVILLGLLTLMAYEVFGSSRTELKTQVSQLQQSLKETEAQYENIQLMEKALNELASFHTPQYQMAHAKLIQIINSVPPSAVIERITFSENEIRITGYDNEAARWLGPEGLNASQLDIRDLPQKDAFTASFRISAESS